PRAMMENAGRFVSPVLPAGAALRPVKATLLRILRIVTRDQTTFNSALLEAVRGALLETEAGLRDLAAASAEARDGARGAAEAREDAGRETVASQRRLDALEKDRDQRFEALAREREQEAAARREEQKQVQENREGLRMLRLEWTSLRSNLQNL